MLTRSLASAVALLAVGCALPSETDDVGGRQALSGGLPDIGADAREQEERDAVVQLGPPGDGTGHCMGTLASPRLVLTAWHCETVRRTFT